MTMKKIMLITGASRGIGAEIAILAGRRGFQVGVNYLRSETEAHAVVALIKAEGCPYFLFYQVKLELLYSFLSA